MKRKLTPREWMLLGVLAVVAAVSGYMMLFRMPLIQQRDGMQQQIVLCQEQLEAAQARVTNKQRMERELKALFEKDPDPLSLAPYDNLQPVMVELHRVLSAAQDYSLAFSTVETEETIVRRSISLSFTSGSYSAAKDILKELHDGMYRCLLSDLSITIGQEATNGLTTVSGTIVFFEYQVEG